MMTAAKEKTFSLTSAHYAADMLETNSVVS